MKTITTSITMMTLLMGLSYTDDYEFKNLDYNDNYKFNNKNLYFYDTENHLQNDFQRDRNDIENLSEQYIDNEYMSVDIIVLNDTDDFANTIIEFVIARCNDGVVDHADTIYEACYYNGGINFLINK